MRIKHSMEKTREIIESTLAAMVASGDKINVSAVAKRIGINHSYIHNDFPDLKFKIDKAKAEQQAANKRLSDSKLIQRQRQQISKLKQQAKESGSGTGGQTEAEVLMLTKLMETYRAADELRRENEDLKNRILHGTDAVNPETGEVISLIDLKFRS